VLTAFVQLLDDRQADALKAADDDVPG